MVLRRINDTKQNFKGSSCLCSTCDIYAWICDMCMNMRYICMNVWYICAWICDMCMNMWYVHEYVICAWICDMCMNMWYVHEYVILFWRHALAWNVSADLAGLAYRFIGGEANATRHRPAGFISRYFRHTGAIFPSNNKIKALFLDILGTLAQYFPQITKKGLYFSIFQALWRNISLQITK